AAPRDLHSFPTRRSSDLLLMDTDYRRCCADFDPALTVLTAVLSKTEGERIVVDAGLKSLSCERGIPAVKDLPGVATRRLTAEHRSEEHTSELQSRGHLVC